MTSTFGEPPCKDNGETIHVAYSIWVAIILIFFAASGCVAGIICLFKEAYGIGATLLGGGVVIGALLPFSRSTVFIFGPSGLILQVSLWRHMTIAWEGIVKAELVRVSSGSSATTTYLCLNVTADEKQRAGPSSFANFMNFFRSGSQKYDYWIVVDLLTMSPDRIVATISERMAEKNSV